VAGSMFSKREILVESDWWSTGQNVRL